LPFVDALGAAQVLRNGYVGDLGCEFVAGMAEYERRDSLKKWFVYHATEYRDELKSCCGSRGWRGRKKAAKEASKSARCRIGAERGG